MNRSAIRQAARLVAVAALLAGACGGPAGSPTTGPTEAPTTASTTTSTTGTSTTTTTTTTSTTTTTTTTTTTITYPTGNGNLVVTEDVPFTSQLSMDVLRPSGAGPWPVVVVFHGGGWVAGDPDNISPLAAAVALRGAVVFNAPYRLALRGGGYPMTFEDAACAVRFARLKGPEYGGTPGRVTLVGYSAGAHIGAVTALAGDSFRGDCLADTDPGLPNAFVGVAGPYDSDLLDPFLAIFFGTDRAVDPGPWEHGNPFTHIGANPDLRVRLIQGDEDRLVPAGFARQFEAALREAGYDVELDLVPGGTHDTVVDPTADGPATVDAVFEVSG